VTKPIPEGHPSVRPYLHVDGAAEAIDFYTKAFGARERLRLEVPGGMIAHAEIEVGDSLVMLCDPLPHFVSKPPPVLGGTSGEVLMYVEDVDAVVQRAVDAGATLTTDVADQVWGDRSGMITDPFGQVWVISTHVEDLTPEQIAERARAAMNAR
jgi:PhnB protein